MLKKNNKNILYRVLLWVITGIIITIILFPVLWIILSSFKPVDQIFTTPINYIPKELTIINYISLFKNINVMGMVKNTLIIIMSSTFVTIFFSLLAAYSFVRYKFMVLKIILLLLIGSSFLPILSSLIPLFQYYRVLGLIDSYLGLIILYSGNMIPFTTIIFVSFIQKIPIAIEEAAEIDGAGSLRKIFSIILPLARPAIATLAIINFIIGMNEFVIPLIFSHTTTTPLSVGITIIPRSDEYQIPWEQISSLATIMLLPLVIFVTVFQKYIMEGLMAGSLKQ